MVKMEVFASALSPEGPLRAGFNPDKSGSFAIRIFSNLAFVFSSRRTVFRAFLLRRVEMRGLICLHPSGFACFFYKANFAGETDFASACSANLFGVCRFRQPLHPPLRVTPRPWNRFTFATALIKPAFGGLNQQRFVLGVHPKIDFGKRCRHRRMEILLRIMFALTC